MRLEGIREDGGGMVWALEALDDGTLVTGDSSGRVQVRTVTMFHINGLVDIIFPFFNEGFHIIPSSVRYLYIIPVHDACYDFRLRTS